MGLFSVNVCNVPVRITGCFVLVSRVFPDMIHASALSMLTTRLMATSFKDVSITCKAKDWSYIMDAGAV